MERPCPVYDCDSFVSPRGAATSEAMKRYLLFALTLVAVGVGLIHLQMALRALFVFREGESVWSWITVLAGPGSTLVSAIVAWFSPRIGGACLLLGGGASLFAAIVEGCGPRLVEIALTA